MNFFKDLDSPHGEGSTLCRQIFSTQRLLALDSDGNVTIDTFELPSACVCKTKIKSFADMLSPRYCPNSSNSFQISFLNESDFFNQNKCHFNFQNITICLRRWFLRSQTTNSIHQAWPFQPWSKQFWWRSGPNERYTLVQNLICIRF